MDGSDGGALAGVKIHHVAMRTRDPVRLEAFYAGVLGMSVARRDGARSVWLRAGEAVVMLERADAHEPPVSPGTLELVAFAVAEADLPGLRARFAAAAIPVEAETAFTLYVRDPDGRRVGVSCYAL